MKPLPLMFALSLALAACAAPPAASPPPSSAAAKGNYFDNTGRGDVLKISFVRKCITAAFGLLFIDIASI